MATAIPATTPAPPASIIGTDRLSRVLHIGASAGAILGGLLLAVGGAATLPQAMSRPALDQLQSLAAHGRTPSTRAIMAASQLDPSTGVVADGDLYSAAALADLLLAERAGIGQERPMLENARQDLITQAKLSPANPYLWARLASIELALGGPGPETNARAGDMLKQSIRLGRNASGAWPARVAIGFRIWPDAPGGLRKEILAEAQRMWFKAGDRYWDRRAMQAYLADLAIAYGMTDRIATLVATAPEDLARWNHIVSQRAARL